MKPASFALALCVLAGCAPGEAEAPFLSEPTPQQHDKFFPIVTGTHGNVSCNACHGTAPTFAQFNCMGCHTTAEVSPGHQEVADFKADNASCYACHPRGELPQAKRPRRRIF